MNLLTRKEIAALIKKTPQYIGVQIKRGHLIEENKRIDTDNKKNKVFLNKFITKEIIEENEEDLNDESLNGINKSNIDYVIKQHDLKLKQVKLKKEILDFQKKESKLIEVIESKDIMQRAIIVLSNQYRQSSKQYLIELLAKYNIPEKDLAGIQKWFDETINNAIKESKDLINTECRIVSDSYSEQLEQGESIN